MTIQTLKNKLIKNGLNPIFDKDTQQWLIYSENKSFQCEKGQLTESNVQKILDLFSK